MFWQNFVKGEGKFLLLPHFVCFKIFFSHILQYHHIDDGSLFKTIRVQSSQLAETNLFAEEESSQCLCRALCSLGTTENTLEWPKLSLGKGLLYSYNIFKQMVEELQEVDPNAKDNFPRLHQTVARYDIIRKIHSHYDTILSENSVKSTAI